MGLNKIQIIGHLGRDPEGRTFPDGGRVTNMTVATTEKWKDRTSGETREHTEWHRVVFTGRLAEIAEQFLQKGAQVYVEGRLRSRKYQDKDGVDKTVTEIRADELLMLDKRQGGEGEQPARAPSDLDDDLPY